MHHVSSPVLRRLVDEPLAVPDLARRHLAGCGRCQALSAEIASDAALAARVLGAPVQVADIDLEWILLQDRLSRPGEARRPDVSPVRSVRPSRRMPRRLAGVSVGAGTAVLAGVLAVGGAAAAVLTTVYSPTQVAPLRVSANDLRAIENITGIGRLPGNLQPSGSMRLSFGDLSWRTASQPQQVSSTADASAITHLAFRTPAALPAGVGTISRVEVQPQVTITVRFSQNAGAAVAGSTLQLTAGPAIVVQYGSTPGRGNVTTLAIAAARRPVATSTGEGGAGGPTTSQLEAFVLSRPGLPAGLAQEIRLLGNPDAILPVPVPSGLWELKEHIGGAPALLVTDPNGFASGVIWESSDGVVHAVGGLLDKEDVFGVAREIG
ncbi:MAG TPA: hypothetical protein VMC83_27800 [Streptosporangiaceae bacterium]|nr:hypothetical protein [Streptosporangiaceae bacterium]